MSQITYVRYPFGKAEIQTVAAAAAIAATINNSMSLLTIGQMTAAGTLNLTVNPETEVGATLMVKVSADGTNRALTPGTGMTGAAVTITASKSFALTYRYDGSNYVHVATQQLN